VTLVPASTSVPEYIGRYKVVERIGKGAMGAVYSAIDEQLGRPVAVKLMLAAFEEDPDLRERFYREARITGQLAHRNIVTVFDLGEYNGRPFIVMELLDGLPLNEHLRSEIPPTLDAKLNLMIQVCDGLQNAHQAGIVHRDIKPSNLMVQPDGSLKVLDFGVARLASSNLTAAGMLLGTPEYMSPEQARGQKMDARADVFSAAGVFYFMLSGRAPFGTRDLRQVLHGIINDEPPALDDQQAPESLRHVLAKGLAKDPERRYQQCADMRVELDQVRRALDTAASRVMRAARDRYHQVVGLIEERRVLGRTLGIAGIDESCDDAALRMKVRFPMFAGESAPLLPMDPAAAHAALESLQGRYNAEGAAIEALRQRASEIAGGPAGRTRTRGSFWRGILKGTR
jgi:eukaryotic-like serine/threonine-protein kinase